MVKFEPPECSNVGTVVACGGDYTEYLNLGLAKEKAFVAKERAFAACSNPFDRRQRDEGASDQRDDAPEKSAIDEYSASCGFGLESMTFDSIVQYFRNLQPKASEEHEYKDLGLFADDGDTKVYNQEEVMHMTEAQKRREEHTDRREMEEANKTEDQRANITAIHSDIKKMEQGQTQDTASEAGTQAKKEVTAEEGATKYLKERLAKYLDHQMKSGKHKKRSKKQKKADLKKHLKKSLKAYLKENPKAENKKNNKDLHSVMEQMVSDAVDEHQEMKKSKKKDKKEKKREEKKMQEAVSETISAITQTAPGVDAQSVRRNTEAPPSDKEKRQVKTDKSANCNLDHTDQKSGDIAKNLDPPLKIPTAQKDIPVETKDAPVSTTILSATSSESHLKRSKPLESSKTLLQGFVATETARLHALEQSFSLEQGDQPIGAGADYKTVPFNETSASVKDVDVGGKAESKAQRTPEIEEQGPNMFDRLIRYRQETRERESREELLDSPETQPGAPSLPSLDPKSQPQLTPENQLPSPHRVQSNLPSDVHTMSREEVDAAIAEELARLQDLQNQFLRKVGIASAAEPSHEIDEKSSSRKALPAKQTKKVSQVQEEEVLSIEEEMARLKEMQASVFEQGRKLTRRKYDE